MSSRLILASGDISSSPILFKRFRGKAAKEIYHCGKGIVLTGSVTKLLGFAVIQITGELTKGVIYSAVGEVGDTVLGYISGIGLIRYLYRATQPKKLKATTRVIYNINSLPLTIYSKGISGIFNFFQFSKLEKIWFGEPVSIFNDNRLWIEINFTIKDIFAEMEYS